ncbi:hypothetical protein evm_007443 [Chilo suppressalis]|nr:hypothetical protein evm_007443 [Chilo suppressalis]
MVINKYDDDDDEADYSDEMIAIKVDSDYKSAVLVSKKKFLDDSRVVLCFQLDSRELLHSGFPARIGALVYFPRRAPKSKRLLKFDDLRCSVVHKKVFKVTSNPESWFRRKKFGRFKSCIMLLIRFKRVTA